MSQPPPRIAQWLSQRYPRPKVDPEWLQACYQWLRDQPGANDSSQKFLEDIEAQLLQSDLTDSMLEGTGLPIHITQVDHREANTRLIGPPVLVEIIAVTEIASSAYQLDQVRVVREERLRLGQKDDGQVDEVDLEVEGEGPVPKYPRGMLRFQLSDGSTTLSAVEDKSLPELVLGQTPLGYKMLLKNPTMRRGIAFLEPTTVALIGYQTEDREALQSFDFARGLRVRMGLPIEPVDTENNENARPQPPAVVQPRVRSPLREISPPPQSLRSTHNDDENLEPRRRKIPPSTNSTVVPTQNSFAPSATLVPSTNATATSQYFSNSNPSTSTSTNELGGFNLGPTTAQVSKVPQRERSDDDEEDLFGHFDNIDFFEGDDVENDENAPPPSKPSVAATSSKPSLGSSRPLVQEESIEIVSVNFSQSQARNKGKGKAKETPQPSPPPATIAHKPADLVFDPDIFEHLDEIDAERFTDPVFLRQQEEEMARIAQTQAQKRLSVPASPSITRAASLGHGKEKGERVIKPLPKTRNPLFLSSQSQSPQPQAPDLPPLSQYKGTAPKKEVIEVDSSSSTSSSPRFVQARRLEEGSIELVENDDDIYEDQDKENVPVMTRHVRRKIFNGENSNLAGGLFGRTQGGARRGNGTGDVIELSDED